MRVHNKLDVRARLFYCGRMQREHARSLDINTAILLASLSILSPATRMVWRTTTPGGDILETTAGEVVTADVDAANSPGLCPCPICLTRRLNDRVREFWRSHQRSRVQVVTLTNPRTTP